MTAADGQLIVHRRLDGHHTDLVIVKLWVLGFEQRVVMLAIQNERVRRTSDLGFARGPRLIFLGSWNDGVMPNRVTCRRNGNHATTLIFSESHRSFNQVACLRVSMVSG